MLEQFGLAYSQHYEKSVVCEETRLDLRSETQVGTHLLSRGASTFLFGGGDRDHGTVIEYEIR